MALRTSADAEAKATHLDRGLRGDQGGLERAANADAGEYLNADEPRNGRRLVDRAEQAERDRVDAEPRDDRSLVGQAPSTHPLADLRWVSEIASRPRTAKTVGAITQRKGRTNVAERTGESP